MDMIGGHNGDIGYITWLSNQGWAQEAEARARQAVAEEGTYGIYDPAFDRFDDHLLPDPDLAGWEATLAEERHRFYHIALRGDVVYQFLEAWGHIYDHDCEWGVDVVDGFSDSMYRILGSMVFGEDEGESDT